VLKCLPARAHLSLLVLVLVLAGCGEKSSPSSATAPPPPVQPPPPGALAAFSAVAGDGEVTLHWRLPTDGSAASAVIRRKTGGAPTGPTDGEGVYDGSDTTAVDRAVTNGTSYTYAAWARATNGDLAGPSAATARPLPPPPAAPGALTATAGAGSVSLTWQNPGGSFDHVRVVLKAGSQPSGPNDGTVVYEGSGTSATATDLVGGQLVNIAAWSFDSYGQTSAAARTTATPTAPAPEFQDLSLAAWSQSHLFPDHPLSGAGDRDFDDRGPHVTARLHYVVDGANVNAVLDYRAEETAGGDGTWAAKTFTWTLATVPAGWTFDSWADSTDQTVEYVDTDHDRDRFPSSGSFPAAQPIEHIEFVGSTSGDDVGSGTTKDDTQIWQINARARRYRIRH